MRRRCLYRGCRTMLANGSYCPDHRPYGPGWAVLSSEILRRDDYRCRCEGCGSCEVERIAAPGVMLCSRTATTVDHIDGNALNNDVRNLRSCCRPCNSAKGGIA